MTKRQWNAAVAILKNDCGLRKRYWRKGGMTCAIGALALASGVSRQKLKNAGNKRIETLPDICAAINEKFGFETWQLEQIQTANDSEAKREDRVDSVIAEMVRFGD